MSKKSKEAKKQKQAESLKLYISIMELITPLRRLLYDYEVRLRSQIAKIEDKTRPHV